MTFEKFVKYSIFLFPFLFVALALRHYLLGDGIALFSELMYSENFNLLLKSHLHAWDNAVSLGHNNLVYPEALGDRQIYGSIAPLSTLIWLLTLTFLQQLLPPLTQKLYFIFILVLPFFAMYPLAKYWFSQHKNASLAIFFAVIFYGINGTTTARFLSGSLNHNIAHGLLPLLIYFYLKAFDVIKDKKIKKSELLYYALLGGFVLSFIIQLRVHYLIIFCVFVTLHLIVNLFIEFKTKIRKRIEKGFLHFILPIFSILFVSLLLNVHQWLPLLFFQDNSLENKSSFSDLVNLILGSENATIFNAIKLIPNMVAHKEYLHSFFPDVQNNILLFLPLLLSLITIFVKKTGKEFLLLIILLISILLGMGLQSPLGKVFEWVYLNTPFLTPFRDPTKFLSLTAICYALLIGTFITIIIQKRPNLKTPVLIGIILYIFFANRVFFSGNFAGNIKNLSIPESYYQLQTWTRNVADKQQRIFLLPSRTSIFQYSWYPKNISISVSPNLFHGVIPLDLPMANTGWNNSFYGMRYYHYLDSQINNSFPLELWKINTKYVVIDTTFEEGKMYLEKVNKIPQLKKIKQFDNLVVFENMLLAKESTQIIHYPKFAYLVGDINIATFSGKIPFVSLYQNRGNTEKNIPIYFYNSGITDLVAAKFVDKYQLDINDELKRSMGATKNDWVLGTSDMQPHDNGIDILSTTPIMTYTKAKIAAKYKQDINQKVKILIRPGFNLHHGSITLSLNGRELQTINLDTPNYKGFTWIDLGNKNLSAGEHSVAIQNNRDLTSNIDSILVVPYDQYTKEYNEIRKYAKTHGIQLCSGDFALFINKMRALDGCDESLYIDIVHEDIASFLATEERNYTYKTIPYASTNPSNYTITPPGNGLLVLNQSHDPNWVLGNQKSIVANLFGNGFILKGNSSSNSLIYYNPEQLFKLSIIIAIILYGIVICSIVFIKLLFFINNGRLRTKYGVPIKQKQSNLQKREKK